MTRRPDKLSRKQRQRRSTSRKMTFVTVVVLLVGLLTAADRMGLFGRIRGSARPNVHTAQWAAQDYAKYNGKSCRVVRVVDGDTLDVSIPDQRWSDTRIRLWGVDTPETVKPNTPVQYFGPQASHFTKQAAMGKTVRLELVPGDTRGKYGRLLAYVYLPDGTMLNRELVRMGYAYADPRYPHPHAGEFRRLQRQAMAKRIGLWKGVQRSDLPYYYRDSLKLP